MRKTTEARVLAVQALYQFDVRGPAFQKELVEFLKGSTERPEVAGMAEELFYGCLDNRDAIDAVLAEAAENWDLSRMAIVDRAILRLGAFEMVHKSDVPPKVAIDEAVRLAKKFSTAESGAFVNGILDRVMALRHKKPKPVPGGAS